MRKPDFLVARSPGRTAISVYIAATVTGLFSFTMGMHHLLWPDRGEGIIGPLLLVLLGVVLVAGAVLVFRRRMARYRAWNSSGPRPPKRPVRVQPKRGIRARRSRADRPG